MINYDELVEKYLKLGISKNDLPKKEMLKSEEDIKWIKEAAKINNACLDEVERLIKPGMSTEDINKIVHEKTIEMGGIPAPLNYEGFPKSCCTSINDAVCHGIPSKNDILKSGDIINVDCTTIYHGHYADASRMFLIGNVDESAKDLVKTTKEALDLAVKELKPYSRLRDIGATIEHFVKQRGYSVVHEIGGHGVGNDFHEDPFVYHYGKKGTGMVLFPGMVITIEPMVNEGSRHVFLDSSNDWTIYTDDGGWSAQWEYTILIKEDGVEILAW